MATAATAAKQNSNKKRGGERENRAPLCPSGVFKVKWDVASQVGGGQYMDRVLMWGGLCGPALTFAQLCRAAGVREGPAVPGLASGAGKGPQRGSGRGMGW